jgi:aminoglycoside 6'-N-acetyltransferase I
MRADLRRIVNASDAAVLFGRIADDVFDAPIDPTRLTAYLAQPGHLMVVAVTGGEVVGQARAIVHRHPDQPTELYIDNLGVAPPHRRQGIARALLSDLIAWGRSLGCEEAWIGTEPDNDAARALYASLGCEARPMVIFEYVL